MNYNEAMQYIESLGKFGIHLGMERITGLVELLDHPERKIRTIHITGNQRKGERGFLPVPYPHGFGEKDGVLYVAPLC